MFFMYSSCEYCNSTGLESDSRSVFSPEKIMSPSISIRFFISEGQFLCFHLEEIPKENSLFTAVIDYGNKKTLCPDIQFSK